MKAFCVFLSLFGLLNASHYELDDIKIQEGDEIIKENIVSDKDNGVLTAHTAKHSGRAGVTELIDSVNGIVANKFDKDDGDRFERVCIINKFHPQVDLTPLQAIQGLKIAHNKMPKVIEEVNGNYILEDFEKVSLLPKRIRSFCSGLKIVRKRAVASMEEANKLALKEALAAKKDARKRAIVKEYTACTNASTMILMTCAGDKLRSDCKVRKNSCTYWIRCPLDLKSGGFNCKGLHKLNSMLCCDFKCNE